MKKKYGSLGLVDPEAAKISILCKWIIQAMEPNKFNVQLMLRYKLARFNPQRRRNWGVNPDWYTRKQHQGFYDSKVWNHISKVWKVMVEGIYQISPCIQMNLLHSNIWWLDRVEFYNKEFIYFKGSTSTAKASNVMCRRYLR
jgi:hypothetical protein